MGLTVLHYVTAPYSVQGGESGSHRSTERPQLFPLSTLPLHPPPPSRLPSLKHQPIPYSKNLARLALQGVIIEDYSDRLRILEGRRRLCYLALVSRRETLKILAPALGNSAAPRCEVTFFPPSHHQPPSDISSYLAPIAFFFSLPPGSATRISAIGKGGIVTCPDSTQYH